MINVLKLSPDLCGKKYPKTNPPRWLAVSNTRSELNATVRSSPHMHHATFADEAALDLRTHNPFASCTAVGKRPVVTVWSALIASAPYICASRPTPAVAA